MPVCLPACQPVYLYACMYIWWGLHTNKDFWSLRSSRPSPAESGGLSCSCGFTSGTHGVSRNGEVTECPSSGLFSASGKTRCQKPNLRDQFSLITFLKFSLITSLSKPPNHFWIRNTWVLAEAIQIQAWHPLHPRVLLKDKTFISTPSISIHSFQRELRYVLSVLSQERLIPAPALWKQQKASTCSGGAGTSKRSYSTRKKQ